MTKTARNPWDPANYEIPDVAAIQALARGDAAPEQQKRALKWIIESAAMTYDQSFVPGHPEVGPFIEGRRSVGNQVVKLMKLPIEALKASAARR